MNKWLIAISMTITLTACSSSPVYRPADSDGDVGYRVTELTEDKYRVTFRGSRSTSADSVRDFALLRAAEVTLQNGSDWFEVLRSDSTSQQRDRHSTSSDVVPAHRVTRSCGLLGCTTTVDPAYVGVRVETLSTDAYHTSSIEIALGKGEPDQPRRVYDAAQLASSIREAHNI